MGSLKPPYSKLNCLVLVAPDESASSGERDIRKEVLRVNMVEIFCTHV
jgi:hypothetical protein